MYGPTERAYQVIRKIMMEWVSGCRDKLLNNLIYTYEAIGLLTAENESLKVHVDTREWLQN